MHSSQLGLLKVETQKLELVIQSRDDKIKILEGDKGFWGKILKMGMKKTKKQKIIKQSKRTLPRHIPVSIISVTRERSADE